MVPVDLTFAETWLNPRQHDQEVLGFEEALARMIGERKCSKVVVECISVLCGGNLAFVDGVELAQLQTFLPSAVAKSVWVEVSKREFL